MHNDARQRIPDTSYFVLGNGHIHAVVQVSADEEASQTALMLNPPGQAARPKQEWLNFDPEHGFSSTRLVISTAETELRADGRTCTRRWVQNEGIPTVEISWSGPLISVRERFFCPDRTKPQILRELRLTNPNKKRVTIEMSTGNGVIHERMRLDGYARKRLTIRYRLTDDGAIEMGLTNWSSPLIADVRTWDSLLQCYCFDDRFARAITAARTQLGAQLSADGAGDARLWSREPERNGGSAALLRGLLVSGYHGTARSLLKSGLEALAHSLQSDSRPAVLEAAAWLSAARAYALWTGDSATLEDCRPQLLPAAEYLARSAPENLFKSEAPAAGGNYWCADTAEHGVAVALQAATALRDAAELPMAGNGSPDAAAWQQTAQTIEAQCREQLRELSAAEAVATTATHEEPEQNAAAEPSLAPEVRWNLLFAASVAQSRELNNSITGRRIFSRLQNLWNQTYSGGGYGRFDVAFETEAGGGRPLCSLWMAQAAMELGQTTEVQRTLEWLLATESAAGTWFETYPPAPQRGQERADSSDALDPVAWAALLHLFIHHVFGIRPDGSGVRIKPRPISGCEEVRISIPIRNCVLVLIIHAAAPDSEFQARVDEQRVEAPNGELHVEFTAAEHVVELFIPDTRSLDELTDPTGFGI